MKNSLLLRKWELERCCLRVTIVVKVDHIMVFVRCSRQYSRVGILWRRSYTMS
jgi:hypothetical protein